MPYFARGKNKIQGATKSQDLYNYYLSTIERGSVYEVPYPIFEQIIVEYTKAVMDLVFEGNSFFMPVNMGSLDIRKKKVNYENPKYLSTNWEMYNKHQKVIYHLNEHTDGYRYKFHWDKRKIVIKDAVLYKVKISRANKRRLASILKNREADYLEE